MYEHDAFTTGDFGPYSGASNGYTKSVEANRAKCPVSDLVAHRVGAWLPMTELMADTNGIDEIIQTFEKVSHLRNYLASTG